MPPLILLVIAFGVGHQMAKHGKREQPQIRIDAGMPVFVREEVIRALLQETNAQTLSAFADQIATQYPNSAFELRAKAWVMSGRKGALPDRPATMQAQAEG